MPRKKARRRLRGAVLRRWVAVGALALVGLLYFQPLKAYVDARGQLSVRQAAVHRLQAEQTALEQRLKASSSLAVLAREARALGYVRKGEHLFIVKNVEEWRRLQRERHAHAHGRQG